MRIRMAIHITGNRNGEPWPQRGEEIDLPDHEAQDLITARLAHPVEATDAHVPDQPAPDVDDDAPAPADDVDPAAVPDGDAPTGDAPEGLDALGKDQLIALAAKHGIDVSARWGAARLRTAIAETLAG